MDKKKMALIAGTVLAYKPMMDAKQMKEFAMPEIVEPTIVVSPSGQERRRERRKQARKK